jgi:hypothetical protein
MIAPFGDEKCGGDMSNSFVVRLALFVGLALLIPAADASAQSGPSVRVRGTIERADGDVLVVKARDGTEVTVKLLDGATAVAVVKASLSDIKPGSYVGVTGMPQADGTQRAVEVHVFPESMRGMGDGHRSWDLRPQSTMTNGSIEHSVTGVEGQTLKVKYKDGEKSIVVPQDTPVVMFAPGNKSDLKPGTKIFINGAVKDADGTIETKRINYGQNGLEPPM